MRNIITSGLLALSLASCGPEKEAVKRTDETKLKVATITKTVTPGSLTITVEHQPQNMATWAVPGKYIRSPFAPSFASDNLLINVSEIKSGVKVKCPYSGKDIIIPELPDELKEKEEEPKTPTARWLKGAEGLIVFSPFSNGRLVDVKDMKPGTTAICPTTGKKFIIPLLPKPISSEADAESLNRILK